MLTVKNREVGLKDYGATLLLTLSSVLAVRTVFRYSNLLLTIFLALICYKLILALGKAKIKYPRLRTLVDKPKSYLPFLLISIPLSIALLYSSHLVIKGSLYSGTVLQNSVKKFDLIDIFNFAAILVVTTFLFSCLSIKIQINREDRGTKRLKINMQDPSLKTTIVTASVILLAWLPYLLAYWPGLVFGDTTASLYQLLNNVPLNNHHPVAFTLTLGFFLKLAKLLGCSISSGVAFYSLMQMIFLAGTFGYISNWLKTRCQIDNFLYALLVICIGTSAYLASYSIALWKDPIFSASLAISVTQLTDWALTNGKFMYRKRQAELIIFITIACLFRNNGIYVSCIGFIAVIVALIQNKRKPSSHQAIKKLLIPFGTAIAISLFIMGPIYSSMNVQPTEPAETLGIPLNQMARVAALNGNMGEDDRAFMNEILPLDQYRKKYKPSCTDQLKWDPMFNSKPLNSPEFFKHWLQMFVKNPKIYLDAWVYQTFGFWSPTNMQEIIHEGNFTGGMPINFQKENSYEGIQTRCLLPISNPQSLFPIMSRCAPAGIIFWIALSLTFLSIYHHSSKFALPLLIILGLYGSLFIASPIWYWPRYIAAAQFAIPSYLVIFKAINQGE